MVKGTMQSALGDEKFQEALRSNVIAAQVAQAADQSGEVQRPEEETVSVLEAMHNSGQDRSDELNQLPPSRRAREAAAAGFAAGTGSDRKNAGRYFDIAFSALNDVWSKRKEIADAPAVVEEVCDAAAQVNPTSALTRAQHLDDPTAQAIGMLSVARVVGSKEMAAKR
jgi:hypothetical protein